MSPLPHGRQARGLALTVSAVLLVVALVVVAALRGEETASVPGPDGQAASGSAAAVRSPRTLWGLVGGYEGIDLSDARRRGVDAVLVEMSWSEAHATPDTFDEDYLDDVEERVVQHRQQGFEVALNMGVHEAPRWLLDRPGAQFVDQHGAAYDEEAVPDLVFGLQHRQHAEDYVAQVLSRLGRHAFVVRVGGGRWGELSYPPSAAVEGQSYWAFSEAAQSQSPVPGWRPCSDSPAGEAELFLDWYRDALVEFQDWQVESVREHYAGLVAVLYPSVPPRDEEVRQAADGGLCGQTSGEVSAAIPRGFDHARQVAALDDPGVAVWSTWFENAAARQSLLALARRHGREVLAENAGDDDAEDMAESVRAAAEEDLLGLFWVRAETAYCRCGGAATIEDYGRAIAEHAERK